MKKSSKDQTSFDQLISVIMPTYNSEKTVKDAIGSIFKQNINNNIEIIIVDDKSSDQTVDVIKTFNNRRNISFS